MGIKIDGNRGFGSMLEAQKVRKSEPAQQPGTVKAQDKVAFSAILQGASRTKETSPIASAERAEKVQALRSQIESGNYRPDLEKVAASLLKFLAADKES